MDSFSAHRHGDDSMTLSPPHTAVLVVDMMNDFCAEGGAMVLPGSERLVPPQNAVIRPSATPAGPSPSSRIPTGRRQGASANSSSGRPTASRAAGAPG